jgi:RHS repeat-associated protein
VTAYNSFNGQRIALRKDGVLYYLHTDHVGSVVLTSDSQANTPASFGGQRFLAYGQRASQYGPPYTPVPSDDAFTGQKLDGTGLIYMNARYYDPQLGTFISPDSLVPDASSLADYNRYMYARGNPMRYTDPSGHDGWDVLVNAYFAVTDFGFGVGAQVGYNTTSIAVPGESNSLAVQSSESTAKTVGRHVGNVISLAQAAGEMVGGAGIATGGIVVCASVIGCLATPAAEAAGVAVGVHGVVVGANAINSEATFLSNVMMAVTGGSDSGYSDYEGNMQNLRKLTNKEVRKYGLHQEKSDQGVPPDADLYVDQTTGRVYFKVNEKNAPYQKFLDVSELKKSK